MNILISGLENFQFQILFTGAKILLKIVPTPQKILSKETMIGGQTCQNQVLGLESGLESALELGLGFLFKT